MKIEQFSFILNYHLYLYDEHLWAEFKNRDNDAIQLDKFLHEGTSHMVFIFARWLWCKFLIKYSWNTNVGMSLYLQQNSSARWINDTNFTQRFVLHFFSRSKNSRLTKLFFKYCFWYEKFKGDAEVALPKYFTVSRTFVYSNFFLWKVKILFI